MMDQTTYVGPLGRATSTDGPLGRDNCWPYSAYHPWPFSPDAGGSASRPRTQLFTCKPIIVWYNASLHCTGAASPLHTYSDRDIAPRRIGPAHPSHRAAAISRPFIISLPRILSIFQCIIRVLLANIPRQSPAAHDCHALIVPARNSACPSHGPLPHSRDPRAVARRGGESLPAMARSRACCGEAQSQRVC